MLQPASLHAPIGVSPIDLGPIAPLMLDDTVTDILINGFDKIYVDRRGKLELTDLRFGGEDQVRALAEALVKAVGRTLDPQRPLVDARLADGSRINIISPPLSVDGTTISIRKFPQSHITLDIMAQQENISQQLAEFLKVCGRCRLNILISGGTGSGKTTLLNAISQYIDPSERIVTVEDAAELRLNQPHVVRLETKPPTSSQATGEEVSMRDLVKNALRMRPDRIIIGEVRGGEAFDMLQAMNTGHEGSLGTIHSNHPRDALARLENMISMNGYNLTNKGVRMQIASALHLIVQVSRMRDGVRRITYVSEITGMEGDIITMQDIFKFNHLGEDENGMIKGTFQWTSIMPRFIRRVAYWGETERFAKALGTKLPKY